MPSAPIAYGARTGPNPSTSISTCPSTTRASVRAWPSCTLAPAARATSRPPNLSNLGPARRYVPVCRPPSETWRGSGVMGGETGHELTGLSVTLGFVRADRLVAILLLLQQRGQVTAAEVAEELEVSERTARRDLDALGMAGLPIYSQQGRNGGWRLAGGGRTDLSGLTAGEARALFLLAGPSPSVTATPQVKAALRKLVRALPEPLRSGAEAASAAVVVDPRGWGDRAHPRPAPPLLDAVQRAVVEGEQVTLGYVARNREPSTRVVHPLGLAAKGSTWYLVADTDAGLRTFRIDRMRSVDGTGEPVIRPDGFDLGQAWQLIADEIEQRRTPTRAR